MAQCVRYSHLAVAVNDVGEAESFYAKVGFRRRSDVPGILGNDAGLGLCLLPATVPPPDGRNILMDMDADAKYPGINHMSFGVPSVSSARAYLEGSGIPPSGTRGKLAVFVRDPSRNTLEFERNDGIDEGGLADASVLSAPPRGGIDHVGIRVSDTPAAADWYGRALGFSDVAMRYDLDADPLKNMRPWIVRTRPSAGTESDTTSRPPPGCIDINLIPNCTKKLPHNALLPSPAPEDSNADSTWDMYPGIVYVAFEVRSVRKAAADLESMGIRTFEDGDVGKIGLPRSAVKAAGEVDCESRSDFVSLFLCDPDKNIIRLVGPL